MGKELVRERYKNIRVLGFEKESPFLPLLAVKPVEKEREGKRGKSQQLENPSLPFSLINCSEYTTPRLP